MLQKEVLVAFFEKVIVCRQVVFMKVPFYIVVSSTNKAGSAYYFIFLRSVRSIYTNEQNKTGLKGAENSYKNKTGLN